MAEGSWNPLFFEDPPILPTAPFSNFVHPILCFQPPPSLLFTDPPPIKYILTPPITCTQHLSILHWINNLLIPKIYFPQCLCFSKFTHLLISHYPHHFYEYFFVFVWEKLKSYLNLINSVWLLKGVIVRKQIHCGTL